MVYYYNCYYIIFIIHSFNFNNTPNPISTDTNYFTFVDYIYNHCFIQEVSKEALVFIKDMQDSVAFTFNLGTFIEVVMGEEYIWRLYWTLGLDWSWKVLLLKRSNRNKGLLRRFIFRKFFKNFLFWVFLV